MYKNSSSTTTKNKGREGAKIKVSLRERILTAARETFFNLGFYNTTTREIAQRAGTSESGIFRIFASKYQILMEVYNLSWKQINERIESEIEKVDVPEKKILCIAETVFRMYEEDKICMSFIIMNTGNTDTLILDRKENSIISEENLNYIGRLQELCKEYASTSSMPKLLTPFALCEGMMSLIEGILLGWYLADNSSDYPYRLSMQDALNMCKVFLGKEE